MDEKKNALELILENNSLRNEIRSLNQALNDNLIHKQQLDAILDNAPLEVCLKDREGCYIKVNKQFEELLGVKNQDMMGLFPVDIVDPKLAAFIREHDLSVLNSGQTEWRERIVEWGKENQPRTFSSRKFPVLSGDGEVLGLGGIVTEITAQVKIENKLQKSNILFRQAESMGNMGHWTWDFVEDKLISCSDQFARIFDMTVPEALDYFISTEAELDVIHPDDKESFSQSKCDSKGAHTKIDLEYKIITSSGNTRHIYTRSELVLDKDGAPLQSFGTVQDITERKKTELREKSRIHILEIITSGEPLPVILKAIVHAVEQENPAMLCSILLLDDAGKHLLHGVAPSLPDFYNDAIHGIEIGIGFGSCGTAAFTNERVIVDDIQTHPYWKPYKDLAIKAGLGACWSEPICSTKREVLGTFAIYHHNVNYPTEANIVLIEQTASLASIAIERKIADSVLKSSENRLRLALAVTKQAWFDLNVQTGEALTSSEYSKILGYDPAKFHSDLQGWEDSLHPHDRDAVMKAYKKCLSQGAEFSTEYRRRTKVGDWLWFNTTAEIIEWDSSQRPLRIIGIHTDITERKQAEVKLERLAHYDLLTGLPNRVLLADRLSQAMLQCQRRNQSLAVTYLDLDGFKIINDTHGHDVGDELLTVVSQRMREALREGDTLARIGGDEFVAVIVDLEKIEDSKPVLERILKAAAESVTLGDAVLQISASIGVTVYPQDGVDADQLMRHADQAMYIAKQAGKNRYHLFDTALDNAVNIRQ
jgi:diguanylate cyclase (GGDEF)-like protein/PAS domain S-box-containing protein